MWLKIFYIAAGGALGAVSRYAISAWAAARLGQIFPWGTLIANLIGCALLGLLAVIVGLLPHHEHVRSFALIGFLGALTTFSTFCFESWERLERGELWISTLNVTASVFAGLGFIFWGCVWGDGLLAGSIEGGVSTDFTEQQNFPFMIGVYLAVNAVRDAFLLVDGPDCAHMKTQYVQGNHDCLSTLTDISGFHRIANTAAHPLQMARSREPELVDQLVRMASHHPAGLVLVCPLPMAALTGVDYDRLSRLAAERAGGRCPVVAVPGRSLSGDWLTGYALTLESLARTAELGEARPEADQVALVGYLWDRNEGDHQANLRELERLLGQLDLKLSATWLSGGSYEELLRIRHASLVLSLPYGRRAARVLARRLGTPLIETSLPFGFEGTSRWLRAVAAATGREDRVEGVIQRELERVIPPLQWVVPSVFLHRTVAVIGDPHLLPAVLELTGEVGLRQGPSLVMGRASHNPDLAARASELEVLFEPQRTEFQNHLRLLREEHVDVVVTNSLGLSMLGSTTPVVEFGFPSFFTHALYGRPFLGFEGALAFCDRLANALRRLDLLRRDRDQGHEPRDGQGPPSWRGW